MLVNLYQLTQCHIWADSIPYCTFLCGITEHSSMHSIMTQEQAMSYSTVRSRNTFDLSWCVTVHSNSEKAFCTKHGIWLSLDIAMTALSRKLAMFKLVYINFNFTKFCSLYTPQIFSHCIQTEFVLFDAVDLCSVAA